MPCKTLPKSVEISAFNAEGLPSYAKRFIYMAESFIHLYEEDTNNNLSWHFYVLSSQSSKIKCQGPTQLRGHQHQFCLDSAFDFEEAAGKLCNHASCTAQQKNSGAKLRVEPRLLSSERWAGVSPNTYILYRN
jgi:hypothetical protein